MTNFIVAEVIQKTGAELFRELLRVYPVAELEDYHKGTWKNELMKSDLQIIYAHREEAGAPDPIPLKEVQMPELPKEMPAWNGAWNAASMVGTSTAAALLAARAQALKTAQQAQPGGVSAATSAKLAAAAGGAGGGAELRLMALFVAKWKLDPTRTKVTLAKLEAQQRRHVIQNFKTTTTALAATEELEQFIVDCTEKDAWPAADAAPVATGTAATPAATPRPVAAIVGVKRPLGTAADDADPNKKLCAPTVVPARPMMPAAAALRAKMLAGQQAGAGIRPVGVRPMIRPMTPGAAATPRAPGMLSRS